MTRGNDNLERPHVERLVPERCGWTIRFRIVERRVSLLVVVVKGILDYGRAGIFISEWLNLAS